MKPIQPTYFCDGMRKGEDNDLMPCSNYAEWENSIGVLMCPECCKMLVKKDPELFLRERWGRERQDEINNKWLEEIQQETQEMDDYDRDVRDNP